MINMIKEVEGVVISVTPFKETSKIINVLTEDGIIGIVAKGAKRINSPLRIATEKLAYSKFIIYFKENNLSTLKEANIINDFKNIKSDLMLISYLSYITELTSQVMKQNNNKEIYDLYINTIIKINDGLNPTVLTNILEIKLLDYLGVPINFDGCAKCGNKNKIVTINPDEGGYICEDCYKDEIIYDSKVQKMLRMYYLVDIKSIKELQIKEYIINDINKFLNDYYDRYTGLYLYSKSFLEKSIN